MTIKVPEIDLNGKIKHAFFPLIITILTLSILGYFQYRVEYYTSSEESVMQMRNLTQGAVIDTSKYIDIPSHETLSKINKDLDGSTDYLVSLQDVFEEFSLNDEAREMIEGMNIFESSLKIIEENTNEIGITENEGLRKSWRETTHKLESLLKKQNDNKNLIKLLICRRYEKDFQLRGFSDKYKNKTADAIEDLIESTYGEANELSKQYKNIVLKAMDNMQTVKQNEQKIWSTKPVLLDNSAEIAKIIEEKKESTIVILNILFISAFFSIIGSWGAFIYYLNRTIVKPAGLLNDLLTKINETGQLSLIRDGIAKSKDGTITNVIQKTILTSFENIERVKETLTTLNQSSEEMKQMLVSISDMSQITSDGATNLAAQSEEMAATTEQIGATAHDVNDKAVQLSEMSSSSFNMMTESEKGVERTKEQVNAINQTFENTKAKVLEISKACEGVNTISEQTNLLALNASIEAARAGEHGRGFAVVADEVRNLATSTQSLTNEIGGMLGQIDKYIINLSEDIQGVDGSVSSLQDLISETKQNLETNNQTAEELSSNMTEIAAAVSQQGQVTTEVAREASKNQTSAEEISNNANESNSLIDNLLSHTKTLNNDLATFS